MEKSKNNFYLAITSCCQENSIRVWTGKKKIKKEKGDKRSAKQNRKSLNSN